MKVNISNYPPSIPQCQLSTRDEILIWPGRQAIRLICNTENLDLSFVLSLSLVPCTLKINKIIVRFVVLFHFINVHMTLYIYSPAGLFNL